MLIRAEEGKATGMATASEINLNQNASAIQMAQTIFGNGVQVTGASYSGSSFSSAIYSGGDSITPGVTPGDTGVILSTGNVDFFTRPSGDPNKVPNISTNSAGQNNRADFNAIAGATTFDAAFLDVSFIPETDVMTIREVPGGDVTYVHLLFDRHQVVWSNGLATESFLPGPQTNAVFEQDVVNEICTLFPELNALTGKGYSPAARRTLKHFEARVLFQGM